MLLEGHRALHMTLRAFPLLFRDTVQLCKQLYASRLLCHSDTSLMKRGFMARTVSWMLCMDTGQLYEQLYDSHCNAATPL